MRLWRRWSADDTLSRKASLNMVAAILEYGARIVVGLLVTPLLVSRLGDLVYGVYQTVGRLVGFATPAGGRPSQALKWTIARHQHSTAYEEKRLQVGSALAVWLIFLPPLAVAGGVLAWVAPLLLGLPDSLHLEVRIAAGLLVAELILTNLLTIPRSVVEGENLGYKQMGLTAGAVLAGGGLMAGLTLLGAGLIGVAAAVLATTVMIGLVYLWVARRNVSWLGVARPSWAVVRGFLGLSGWFLLWNLVMQLLRSSDVVVLGIGASPEDVTVFTLTRYIPEAIFSVAAIVISAVMPGLGGVMGAGETSRAAAVRSETMTGTWLLATASGACFLLIHESFLGLWVGEQYLPGRFTALLIVVMMIQFAFIRNDASIIDLTLELRSKVLLGFLAGLVSIGLALLFLRTWDLGIAGLALGFIAGRGILSVAYPLSVSRSLGVPLRRQILGALRPVLVAAALLGLAVAAVPVFEVGSWPLLICVAVGALGVFGGLAYLLGLSAAQRRGVLRRARAILER